jgi:hypothetical protein
MIKAVVTKPDGKGGTWRLLQHHDGSAELLHRPAPGRPSTSILRRTELYRVRQYLREEGIGEDGWSPE